MELKLTLHAIERSIERIGMTGVELKILAESKLKPKDILHEKPKPVWIKGRRIKLIMVKNTIITVCKP